MPGNDRVHKRRPKSARERFEQVVPILRIFEVAKAREFYVGFLGFKVDWEHRFNKTSPLYMQISRRKLVLHLSEHHGDCCPGSTVFVRMTGLRAFHREIIAGGYKYNKPGRARSVECPLYRGHRPIRQSPALQ